MSTIRFGFIGAGQIAYSSADSVNNHPDGKVVAVQDLSEVRAKKLAESREIPHVYTNADDLLANPEVDVVYIAVPNKFHVPLTIKALEAGKHVILEKPFAMSYEEAKQAAETACKLGKVLTLGMNQRFGRQSQQVRALVESGKLGEIYHAKAYWLRRFGIPTLGTWFGNRELSGGGCLNDIGVHIIDLCLYLVNNFDPVSVTGATYTKFGNRGIGGGSWGISDVGNLEFNVDDLAAGFLRFANGLSVSIEVSWARHSDLPNEHDVELFGTEGSARAVGGTWTRFGTDGYEVVQEIKQEVAFPHCDRFHNFINHLHGKEDLCVTLDQALKVQRILDALNESSRTGREVRFD